MGLMDNLKAGVKNVASKTGEVAETATLKTKITNLEFETDKLYKELGIAYYISGGSNSKESASNVGDLGAIPVRPRVDPWVGKIRWRREWQPTPIFLLGESPWTEEPGGLQSRWSQRIRQG